jgi:hypothetical protein
MWQRNAIADTGRSQRLALGDLLGNFGCIEAELGGRLGRELMQ